MSVAKHALVEAPVDAGRRTARTSAAVGLVSIVLLVGALPEVLQVVIDELGGHMPDGVRLWLLGAAAVVTAATAAVTRIMAIPVVNDWLSRWSPFGTVRPSDARAVK